MTQQELHNIDAERDHILEYVTDKLLNDDTENYDFRYNTFQRGLKDPKKFKHSIEVTCSTIETVQQLLTTIPPSLQNVLRLTTYQTSQDMFKAIVSVKIDAFSLTPTDEFDEQQTADPEVASTRMKLHTNDMKLNQQFSVSAVTISQPSFQTLVDEATKIKDDLNTYYSHRTAESLEVETDATITKTDSRLELTLDQFLINENTGMYRSPQDYPLFGWFNSIHIDQDAETVTFGLDRHFEDQSLDETTLYKDYPREYLDNTVDVLTDMIGLTEYTCPNCNSKSGNGFVFGPGNRTGIASIVEPTLSFNCHDCGASLAIPLLEAYATYPLFHRTLEEHATDLWSQTKQAENNIIELETLSRTSGSNQSITQIENTQVEIDPLIGYLSNPHIDDDDDSTNTTQETTESATPEVVLQNKHIQLGGFSAEHTNLSGYRQDIEDIALDPSTRCILCGTHPELQENVLQLTPYKLRRMDNDRDTDPPLTVALTVILDHTGTPTKVSCTNNHILCEDCSDTVEDIFKKTVRENDSVLFSHYI